MTDILTPTEEAELADAVAEAASARTPLEIRGGGTRSTLGRPVQAEKTLSTARLSGISLYEPGALTLVVKAGTPMEEVEQTLAAEGQMLAFEPPDHRALLGTEGTPTIGGAVAVAASGPRRIQKGACRDFMLGVRFVDGQGQVVKNGGRVMKNVTGLDLVKPMAGQYGTLGVLTEIAFKVLPKTDSVTIAVRGVEGLAALDAMTRAVTSPYDVSGVSAIRGEGVYIRLEGLPGSVNYRKTQICNQLKGLGELEVIADAEASASLWRRVRDVEDFSEGSGAVWRVSMKPSEMVSGYLAAATQVVPFDYQLDWAGGLAWIRLTPDQAEVAVDTLEAEGTGPEAGIYAFHESLQDMVNTLGGHATLMRASAAIRAAVDVFQPEPAPLARISAGLRAKFDPHGILNPGRMG